jgi:hypothetical protein
LNDIKEKFRQLAREGYLKIKQNEIEMGHEVAEVRKGKEGIMWCWGEEC